MISKFKLKFGRAAGLSADEITLSPVTIFVGPNNSGKSKILTELDLFTKSGQGLADNSILERDDFGLIRFGIPKSVRF